MREDERAQLTGETGLDRLLEEYPGMTTTSRSRSLEADVDAHVPRRGLVCQRIDAPALFVEVGREEYACVVFANSVAADREGPFQMTTGHRLVEGHESTVLTRATLDSRLVADASNPL